LTPKTWRGGNNETKRKAFRQNIEKGYQNPPRHHLNFKIMSTCQTSLIITSCKKEKIKEIKAKGTLRILMPPKGQQNSTEGTNPRNIRSH
jgi:hypothetical protein